MKKKTGILIGVVITVLLVITGTVGFVLMNYMVLYECQIEFHYEDYRHRNPEPPFVWRRRADVRGRPTKNPVASI